MVSRIENPVLGMSENQIAALARALNCDHQLATHVAAEGIHREKPDRHTDDLSLIGQNPVGTKAKDKRN